MNMLHYLELDKAENSITGWFLKGAFTLNEEHKHFACKLPKRGTTIEDLIESLRELADGLEDYILRNSEAD